jgi:hypothetical protein
MQEEMGDDLSSGRISYHQAMGYEQFFPAHAKNIAHRLARGEIVCNLDADNFTGPDGARVLHDSFCQSGNIFLRSPPSSVGAFGRIAFRKSDFEKLGGYDERFVHGYGFEDDDIIARAKGIGLKETFVRPEKVYCQFIPHGDAERILFLTQPGALRGWERHRQISWEARRAGQFVANRGREWGKAQALVPYVKHSARADAGI